MSDLEIARQYSPLHINNIAQKISVEPDLLELYGKFKAKLPLNLIKEKTNAKLILVTAITPTPAGEGKTTVSVGLTDGLNKIGKKTIAALREPSLGPVFGMKGGATGGGKSQVIPMEDINLHFTGDFSAVEKANNLLCALIDNHIFHNTAPLLNTKTIAFKRVMDMNDRALRSIISGLNNNGQAIETGFNITAASEIMAILCICTSLKDLVNRLGNIFIGESISGEPIYAKDINANGAMAALLKDAIKPNLVQTLEQNPAILHGGPFANIAQGTNSILATKMALSLADYVVTEAGFAADLGAEKFFDLKCVAGNLKPNAVVIVATIKALKYHGGCDLKSLSEPNLETLKLGLPNLEKHIENIMLFGLNPIVAINHFYTDTNAEIDFLVNWATEKGLEISVSKGWAEGGEGCTDLAEKVVKASAGSNQFKPIFESDLTVEDKITEIATKIYNADKVVFEPKAKKQLEKIKAYGMGNLPVCMAKTQKSISDNEKLKGKPANFNLTVKEFEIASGAGFVIPICGNIMRMPGLSKQPAANSIFVDENGEIQGLF